MNIAEIRSQIESAMNLSLPPSIHNAFVVHADTNGGISTAYVRNVGDGWKIEGDLGYHPDNVDGFSAGVSVVKTW